MSLEIRQQVALAVKAIQAKKGENVAILEMDRASGAFTDYFIVCSGTNPRQIQAVADEVQRQLGEAGQRPNSVEGYNQAEWVLLDYVHFVLHVFSERARHFYDLERLWKSARRLTPADLAKKPAAKKKARKAAAKKTSTRPRTVVRGKTHTHSKKKPRKSA